MLRDINNYVLILKIILVSILVLVAMMSLPIVMTSGNTHFKHALRNYFFGVILFYLLDFSFLGKNQNSRLHTVRCADLSFGPSF